ncbi:MAG: ABC transporter ATP-binding protein/permease [Candidatus Pacebacteria bacterium]|jgi:ABC-type multidrug transport system fused ATPase/permease subunit|nr:ABC transporter ATP-binding protein/permease [Candidatus Paceibacterota bacterium]
MKRKFLKTTAELFRPFYGWISVVLLLMLAGQVLGTFSPYLFGRGVDAVTHGDVQGTFVFLLIAFAFSAVQQNILPWIREIFELNHLDDQIEGSLSHRMLQKMFSFSIGQHINEHSGVKQSIVNRGMNALQNFIERLIYGILPNILQIIATLIILAFFDWRVAVVAISFVVIYVFLAYRTNGKFFPMIDEVRRKKQEHSKLQSELFRNAPLVISEGQEEKVASAYKQEHDRVTSFHNKMWIDFLRPYYKSRSLLTIGQYVSLALGTYFILQGQHSVGMFITFYSWMTTIFGNITTIMSEQRRTLFDLVEIRKLYALLDIKPAIDPNPEGFRIDQLKGKIEFNNVSFFYPKRKAVADDEEDDNDTKEEIPTVSGISFTIPAGSKVGFVGVSGSGKSTIVNLMRRYYDPTGGQILIDGVDLTTIDLQWFRSHIGNVEQKIDLFDRSIRDNITFGLPEGKKATDEEISRVIDDASLQDFISGLKEYGVDTYIGEGGIKVSGGERQRIGIARALIKDPRILIFDEATSALDSINEKLIHEAINRGSKGRTTIIIAHRLSTIMDADKIFVVDNGKIVGEGKHADLLKTCKEYKDLIEHQVFMID